MTLKEIVNDVLTTTGLAHAIDTVQALDADTPESKTLAFVKKAHLDVSRKLPNAVLRFNGAVNTVAKVDLHDLFGDKDADGVDDNALSVVNGKSTFSGASDHALPTDTDWVGRLVHFEGDKEIYRITKVDPVSDLVTLGDNSGADINYVGTTKSKTAAGVAVDETDAWAATNSYASGTVAQDRYFLPENFKMPHRMVHFWGPGVMEWLSPEEFDALRFRQVASVWKLGDPSHFTIRTVSLETGVPRFYAEFYPIPDEVRTYPFSYEGTPTTMSADGDTTGFTAEYEQAIVARTRYYVYRFLIRDDTQWQTELQEWQDIFNDQRKNAITSREVAQFEPSTSRDFWADAY